MEKKIKFIYTKYEKARIVGARALQLSMGAPMLIKFDKKALEKIKYSPVEIAKKEFDSGILPITIKRPLPPKMVENK
ncbi:MAG: DNA-directed RNA polymerase subunit K [Candidatus Woesearchaeota archaeon]